ncbi:MAG: PHP domain-containing protein [Treponemataceae bacterium]|nr:PHP domain-containing protein [Treponemataceae bacterium]
MKTVDLHIHSTYSDGVLSVEEIIKNAKSMGLSTISVTDHDTIEQIPDCIKFGREHDIRVIPGIELSCSYKIKSLEKNKGFHLLGYGINPDNEVFKKEMDAQKKKRLDRAKKIADRFTELGFKIDFENRILNKKGSVGKPELAAAVFYNPENQALLEAEKLASYMDFFEAYLSDGGKAFVEREEKLDFIDGIKLIHDAGGNAVWAHSYYNLRKFENRDAIFDELLDDFTKAGLDGIETFYSSFDEYTTKRLYNIAKDKNLIMTAGSDFHELDRMPGTELACWKEYGLVFKLDERLTH